MDLPRETGHMTPSSQLAGLLRGLFDASELRIHLGHEPGGADLLATLPGEVAPLTVLASAAVQALERRGLVDRGFFDRLEAERPNQRALIRRVRDARLGGVDPVSGALWDGRYRLAEQIGDGGFGCVWRAVDEQTGQVVALKILHRRHLDNTQRRQRFFRGAQKLAGLSHPSIVRVYAMASEAGLQCFYVMEYIRGVTLELCVRERRYATSELLVMALQIGDALSHVHAQGLLHRDVKPGNILVTERKLARLIDFDLVTGEDSVALTTEAVGTQLYMPPEAHTSDPKTGAYDVFSLARTIEFILRGREPTVRETADVADIAASADVKAILRAALQTDPQRRIAHMTTFCAALRAALAAEAPAPRQRWRARVRVDGEPVAAPSQAPSHAMRYAAIASICGHIITNVYLAPPPEKALLVLLLFIAPSIRVLVDRERLLWLTVLHWIWIALAVLLTLGLLGTLFAARTSSTPKVFTAVVVLASIGLGVYASVVFLLRSREP